MISQRKRLNLRTKSPNGIFAATSASKVTANRPANTKGLLMAMAKEVRMTTAMIRVRASGKVLLIQTSPLQGQGPGTELPTEPVVMANYYIPHTPLPDLLQGLGQFALAQPIQASGGLVQEDKFWIQGQHRRQGQTLFLAVAEVKGKGISAPLQFKQGQHLFHLGLHLV